MRKKLNKCNLILNVNNGTLELYRKEDWDKFDGFPNEIMFNTHAVMQIDGYVNDSTDC